MAPSASFFTPFEASCLGGAGYFFRDGFFGPVIANKIRREANVLVAAGALREAGIGRDGKTDARIRGDELCWLEKDSAGPGVRALMAQFERLRICMNREFYLGVGRYEMQLALYRPGSLGYAKHFDAFRGDSSNRRRLTAIYYLNPAWKLGQGGELALYLDHRELHVDPLQDRLLVFLAEDIEHAVLPVMASRLALTAWFHSN